MDPDTDEASPEQIEAACEQGRAYGRALELMTTRIADDGGEQRAGCYLVGYAIEEAEGMYEWRDGALEWHAPADENLHVEVSVRDAGDGRFVPGARVLATLIDADGTEFGPHEQPLLWHPMLYHYGRNWTLPHDGDYTLRVRVEPPRFSRHDKINGCRFTRPADVEFAGVRVERGRE
jgi:hypothetical protein